MAQWPDLNYAQKVCVKSAGKLMQQTAMLHPAARVGVAVSGGMDSLVLLRVLTLRQRVAPFHFEIMALHVNPGFDPVCHLPLAGWLADQGLAAHLELADYGLQAHDERNQRNSPCFRCSWLRRKRLFELCDQYGLTHLALGHNAEDLAATFFMNLLKAGRVEGLSMAESFFQGRLRVIRPLLWVEKNDIRRAAKAWQLPVQENPCPTAGSSTRDEMLQLAKLFWQNDSNGRQNIFNAIRRWQLDLDKKLL